VGALAVQLTADELKELEEAFPAHKVRRSVDNAAYIVCYMLLHSVKG
jgi:hypothetical protein